MEKERLRLRKVLLIDDSEAINFIHQYILEEMNCTDEIIIKENGEEAIQYLQSLLEKQEALPELIFTDINMPKMNAWEFISEYQALDPTLRANSIVILLTSSIDPGDMQRAKDIAEIAEVHDKPFNEDVMNEILEKYFKK